MPPAADILSTLPDPLLALILSKIPIREAVRCSVLSKRWRFLYTQIPQLTLSPALLVPNIDPDPDPLSVARVEKIISKLVLLHSPDIEAFHLFDHIAPYGYLQFTRESVWQWVRYAASRNVQHLTLCGYPGDFYDSIPPAFFSCTRLTTVSLSHYKLMHLPSHFSGFNHLITCSFRDMEFTDECLARFISLTPFLEHLSLVYYVGLRNPVISAPNLTQLSLHGVLEGLTVICPKLRTLEMRTLDSCGVRINGVLFHEIASSVSKIKMQGGNNVAELWLNLRYNMTLSIERVFEIVGRDFKTLEKLNLNDICERGQNRMVVLVNNLLERLPGLARLRVSFLFNLVRPKNLIVFTDKSKCGKNLRIAL